MLENKGAPFNIGDAVILDKDFGGGIGGKVFIVEDCRQANACQSGWLIYIKEWARPLDSAWFTKQK